jgi:hypothetical protein
MICGCLLKVSSLCLSPSHLFDPPRPTSSVLRPALPSSGALTRLTCPTRHRLHPASRVKRQTSNSKLITDNGEL